MPEPLYLIAISMAGILPIVNCIPKTAAVPVKDCLSTFILGFSFLRSSATFIETVSTGMTSAFSTTGPLFKYLPTPVINTKLKLKFSNYFKSVFSTNCMIFCAIVSCSFSNISPILPKILSRPFN